MGTRAQFFINDPQDLENREWLGCVAYDGYPDGLKGFEKCKTELDFRTHVKFMAMKRDDFTNPETHDFPFPWKNDLFLTDCTYYFQDGKVMFHYFHSRPVVLKDYLKMTDEEKSAYHHEKDALPKNVPVPTQRGLPGGPDSIMVLSL